MRAAPTNAEHPGAVPLNPMGAIPCLARLEDVDGVSWWVPAIANRWTDTHILVLWRPDGRNARKERTVWLRKADVRPWLRQGHDPRDRAERH